MRVLKTLLLMSLMTFWALNTALADDTDFAKLSEALMAKDDAQALQVADEMEQAGQLSFGLYYNKGLAQRNLAQFAQARASFEKALTYQPRNLEARRRLREVKEKLGPQLPELDVKGTPPWDRTEAELILGLLTLMMLSAAVRSLMGRPLPRLQVAVMAAVFALGWAGIYLNNPPSSRAVLVSSTAKLLEKPEAESSGQTTITGTVFEVLERKSHYVKVRDRKEHQGWLREGEVVEI